MLKKFIHNRKGTAEVIGSVLFIVIILFFFSNVYLWHDQSTRQMNAVLSDKMNSPIGVVTKDGGISVTNNGGVNAVLSRLWIISSADHLFVDLESLSISVAPGSTFQFSIIQDAPGSSATISWNQRSEPPVIHLPSVTSLNLRILTTLGNAASCKYPVVE